MAYGAAGNRIKAIIDTANTIQYTYDSDGRLTSETQTNGQTSTVTTYAYDANGNLIKKKEGTKSTTYTFDVWGNMISADGASYTYNVQGLRTSKTVGNKTTNFKVVNGKVWSDGTYKYVWGAELITNGSVYYLYNAHGDVVQLVNANGAVTKTYDYEAYGNELTRDAADPNPFRYCGEYYDNETGFIYLRARYYDPTVGRFISVDPVKDGLNWYAYCNNNPLLYVDPSGLSAKNGLVKTGLLETVWFSSADEAAYAFGVEHNQNSVVDKAEYSSVIYSKVFYEYNEDYYSIIDIAKMAANGEIASMKGFLSDCIKLRLYSYGVPSEGSDRDVPPDYILGKSGRIEAVVHTHANYIGITDEEFSKEYGYRRGGDIKYADDIYRYGIKYVNSYDYTEATLNLEPFGRGIKGFILYLITPTGKCLKYTPSLGKDSITIIDMGDNVPKIYSQLPN